MKNQILLILKSNTGFVSGEDLSRRLGVSRTAVWKAVKALQQAGYPIEAVTRRGYRLAGNADVLSQEEIENSLAERDLSKWIKQVHYVPVTDSTNQMAREAAGAGALDGSLFVAGCQTRGRGRLGRRWLSSDTQGLWFSLLLRPSAEPAALAPITLFAGLCAAQALQQTLGLNIGLKWPNDLVAAGSGRKVCGILTEMMIEENLVHSVIIGIGLNVRTAEFPEEIRDSATSLFMESGRLFSRLEVLAAILEILAARYPEYRNTDSWLGDYRRLCLTLGQDVVIHDSAGSSWTGRAEDLNAAGELVVIDRDGCRRVVRSGEVSLRKPGQPQLIV
ncbi:MAG TPA: biotin--[acetyl-CoA-carboxylase] ligase [Clostridiales bacterium]|nr:biotin--[acetyl-CoA-carboxylase] ligase [Clostridiales bacterium]